MIVITAPTVLIEHPWASSALLSTTEREPFLRAMSAGGGLAVQATHRHSRIA